jgi:predicted Zn-dependent protease
MTNKMLITNNSIKLFATTAISLVVLSSCQTANKIDKSLYRFTEGLTQQDLVTGQRSLSMQDRAEQIAKGNEVLKKVIKSYLDKGEKINAELNQGQFDRLKRIFDKVHSVSHLRDEEWDVYLVPEKSFNAYVTGGSSMVVHLGALEELSFDDEIAIIIGHEIAHIAANHVFESQTETIANIIAGSQSVKEQSYQAGYSIINEQEADRIGILYAALAGYDPMAAPRTWQKIYRKKGNNGNILSTHPTTSERLEYTEQVASKVREYYIPGKINSQFESILENNNLFQKATSNPKLQPGSGGGLLSVAETFVNSYANKQRAKQQAEIQNQRIAMLKNIEQSLDIVGGNLNRQGQFEMKIRYSGSKPISTLAVRAVSQDKNMLYRVNQIIYPNSEFIASFDKSILMLDDGSKAKIKLIVDEAYYLE